MQGCMAPSTRWRARAWLSAIGCAVVLSECTDVERVAIDAKLVSLAVTRFTESVTGTVALAVKDVAGVEASARDSGEQFGALENGLCLDRCISPRAIDGDDPCTFGGVFPDIQEKRKHRRLSQREVLALFLRAVHPPAPDPKKSKRRRTTPMHLSPADLAAGLLSKLLSVLGCCYREEPSAARTALATEALNALRECLRVGPGGVAALALFRDALSAEHVCALIGTEGDFAEAMRRRAEGAKAEMRPVRDLW